MAWRRFCRWFWAGSRAAAAAAAAAIARDYLGSSSLARVSAAAAAAAASMPISSRPSLLFSSRIFQRNAWVRLANVRVRLAAGGGRRVGIILAGTANSSYGSRIPQFDVAQEPAAACTVRAPSAAESTDTEAEAETEARAEAAAWWTRRGYA